jgi:hypothetical protein
MATQALAPLHSPTTTSSSSPKAPPATTGGRLLRLAYPRGWTPLRTRLAGTEVIDGRVLRAKLGASATAVWTTLLSYRQDNGWAWPLRRTLALVAGLTESQVKRALEKLRACGLVEDEGLRRLAGAHTDDPVWVWVVLGQPCDAGGRLVRLARKTKAAIERLVPRGGKRPGAGRPVGVVETTPRAKKQPAARAVAVESNCTGLESNRPVYPERPYHPSPPKGGPGDRVTAPPAPLGGLPSGGLRPRLDVVAEIEQRAASPAPRKVPKDAAPPPEEPVDETNDPVLGVTLSGSGRGAALHADFLAWVADAVQAGRLLDNPATLGFMGVPLPSPPKLDPSQSMRDRCTQVVRAYRGAIESRYGGRCWVLAQGDIQRSKFFAPLCAAVRALEAHEIAPAAWASWSVDVWRSQESKPTAQPPLLWVFGAKRIDERHGWYRSVTGDGNTQRIVVPAALASLRQRWGRMMRVLWTRYHGGRPDDLLREVTEAFFPNGFDQELADVRADLDHSRVRLLRAVEEGVWCW